MPFLPQPAMLVTMFNMGPLRINRPGLPALNARGAYEDAAASHVEVNPIHVQVESGRELEVESWFDATKETIWLVCRVRLYVADDGQVADVLEYQGRAYRIVKEESWNPHGGLWMGWAQLLDSPFPEEP